jgi:hypothetical protein
LLVFDDAVRVPDGSVNAFVERAMKSATSGDYGAFRLLWTVREEPMPKAKFDEGWQAVEQIRILALEPAIVEMAKGGGDDATIEEKVYLVLAEVRFDPRHPAGKKEPTREAVLMIVREQEQWRLAQAPKLMRDWIREKAGVGEGVGVIPNEASKPAGSQGG